MLHYCCHEYGGKPENVTKAGLILAELQKRDLDNSYISPLHAFSYLPYNSIGYDKEMELCFDLMTACDDLIILSPCSEGIYRETALADSLHIPIFNLYEESGGDILRYIAADSKYLQMLQRLQEAM